jgi:putative chitinase
MRRLQIGCAGQDVLEAQCSLSDANTYTGNIDGSFGPQMQAAVAAFQTKRGLPKTGMIDSATASALGLSDPVPVTSAISCIAASDVKALFPDTPIANIEANLAYILNALAEQRLGDRDMILMALATIAAEADCFLPISEEISHLNTSSPGAPPFDLYDHRKELGNLGPPDGSAFRGRGFIQLTGRWNFQTHGHHIGLDELVQRPTLAHKPEIAAKLLADFLAVHQSEIRDAIRAGNLLAARKAVNGGENGYQVFEASYTKGAALSWMQQVEVSNV